MTQVVLIQVATSTTENHELAETVSEIVTRIDAQHSTLAHQPLVFLRQDIGFSQYLALLSVADALMITSLREGMNLTCHEFVMCQDGVSSTAKYSPVILSEFTGSAAIFKGAEISVNPWDYQKCAEAIKTALEMDPVEKEHRYKKMRDIVLGSTGDVWAKKLQDELAKVHEEHFRRDTMSIPRLNANKLVQCYKNSKKRLIILDYEGTLAPFGNVSKTVLANMDRVCEALNELIQDDNNEIYVMSGRMIEELEVVFGRVPGIGLIAENGCFVRLQHTDEWLAFGDMTKTAAWKDAVRTILDYYRERVEGSSIEERKCSLTFHYGKARDSDETGARQAGDCATHINDACEHQRVRAIPTKDSVIIEPMDWDKGTAAKEILKRQKEQPDFLFVAGNDRDDEVIFRWAKEQAEEGKIANVTTTNVGTRNTLAMTTLTQGSSGKSQIDKSCEN